MTESLHRRRRSDRLIARPDRWLVGGCVLALVLLVSLLLNDRNTRAQQANEAWVVHTHAVIDALTAVQANLRTAEAVHRRYLITGQPEHLAGFDAAVTAALDAAGRVRRMTVDNPHQQARIPAVEQGIGEIAQAWRETSQLRAAQDVQAVRQRVAAGPATGRMGDVLAHLEAMTNVERHLLAVRGDDARQAFTTARVTGVTTGLASLLLVVTFAALLKRHLDRGLADARALRQLSADLREADRRKDRFLATLAHELRNPLAPVRTAAALLTSDHLDRGRLAWVADVIRRQVGHMASLLDDLLDVARITQGKLVLRREPVVLADVVQLAVEAARPVVDRKRHRLEVHLPPGEAPVVLDADPVRLAQALTNLLTNAAKYTDPGGSLQLRAVRRGADLQLAVNDSGVGIAPEALPQVFDMFSQVEGSAGRSEGGLGIGLALTRGVVELHGGSVLARSAGRGHGSEFVITLPGAVLPAGRAPGAHPGGGAATEAPRCSHRVLVADDNHDAGEALGALVQTLGHRVQVVDGGREAIATACREPPDLAFLDIGMPDLDGHAVARALRADPATQGTVLVAVTGWGQAADRAHSAASGFDAHLTKPVDPATVRALLARPLHSLRGQEAVPGDAVQRAAEA